MRGRAILVAVGGGGLTACLISTSGFSGGDGTAPDGGSPSVLESGAPGDSSSGGVNTGDGGALDAAAGPFCASLSPPADLCADFDEGAVEDGWSTQTLGTAGGSHTAATSTFVSAPRSMMIALPAGTGTQARETTLCAIVEQQVGKSSPHLTLDFDLRLDSADSSGYVTIASLAFGSDGRYGVDFVARETQYAFEEELRAGAQPSYPITNLPQPLVLGAWKHVTIDMHLDTKATTITIDGTSFAYTLDPTAEVGRPDLTIGGVYYTTASLPATTLYLDNVVLRLE